MSNASAADDDDAAAVSGDHVKGGEGSTHGGGTVNTAAPESENQINPEATAAPNAANADVSADGQDGGGEDSSHKRDDAYESERELGRGAFGKVTLVRRVTDGRHFVVKSLFISKETMTAEAGSVH